MKSLRQERAGCSFRLSGSSAASSPYRRARRSVSVDTFVRDSAKRIAWLPDGCEPPASFNAGRRVSCIGHRRLTSGFHVRADARRCGVPRGLLTLAYAALCRGRDARSPYAAVSLLSLRSACSCIGLQRNALCSCPAQSFPARPGTLRGFRCAQKRPRELRGPS